MEGLMMEQSKLARETFWREQRWAALEAVADAARALARQWKEEDAGGQPLGWLIDALAAALDALDKEG